MADNSARIRQIREILESGIVEDETDGQRTKFDPESLRKELRRLMAEDDVERKKRPSIYRIDLS